MKTVLKWLFNGLINALIYSFIAICMVYVIACLIILFPILLILFIIMAVQENDKRYRVM